MPAKLALAELLTVIYDIQEMCQSKYLLYNGYINAA